MRDVEMIDCRKCHYGQTIKFKDRFCTAMDMPKPIEYMRDARGECGLRGVLFEAAMGDGAGAERERVRG